MKKLILTLFIILVFASTSHAVATQMFGRSALTGGTKSVDNINIADLTDGDMCIVGLTSKVWYLYIWDSSVANADADNSPISIQPDDAAAANGAWVQLISNRGISTLNITTGETNHVMTEEELLSYYRITNNGVSAAETDVQLPAVSYSISLEFRNEEGQIIEICPPTGEQLGLDDDATLLTANYCVDMDSTTGSRVLAERMLGADGSTWHWSIISIMGVTVDTGASD